MSCCNHGRYLNEQTYLDTVCCTRKTQCCRKDPPRCDTCHDLRYTYRCPRGKLTLHCDEHTAGISIDINNISQ